MNDLQLTTALETIVAVSISSFVFFKLLPMYRVDLFRQSMFALRDELFDYARSGKIQFNDPAYVLLRALMNGFIRYAHHLTVYRTLMTGLHRKINGGKPHLAWNQKWEIAQSRVQDEEVRRKIMSFHNRTVWIVSKHLILGSPVILLTTCVLGACFLLNHGFTSLKQLYQDARNSIMNTLFDARLLEEEAVYTRLTMG